MSDWINVKDRLPKPYINVLVYPFPSCGGEITSLTCTLQHDGCFWLSLKSYTAKKKVTHWMPLPEPPKQEK